MLCICVQLAGHSTRRKACHDRVDELCLRRTNEREIAISDLLVYGLTCIAIPAIMCGLVYTFYVSRKSDRHLSFFKSAGDESLETAQKELQLIEEIAALQRETNTILREMIAKVEQGQRNNQ